MSDVHFSEPIRLLNPHGTDLRVIANRKKGTLTLAFAIGRMSFALQLDARGWNSLNQSTSFPPELQEAAIGGLFSKPASPSERALGKRGPR